nr:hypothetical protein [Propionicimonas sp.]
MDVLDPQRVAANQHPTGATENIAEAAHIPEFLNGAGLPLDDDDPANERQYGAVVVAEFMSQYTDDRDFVKKSSVYLEGDEYLDGLEQIVGTLENEGYWPAWALADMWTSLYRLCDDSGDSFNSMRLRTTREMSVTLPLEMADRAVEAWMREEVVPACDRFAAEPIPGCLVRRGLPPAG